MRLFYSLLFTLAVCTCARAQTDEKPASPLAQLPGAWEASYTEADGQPAKLLMIFSPTHMTMAAYYEGSGEFIATLGGPWQADWENLKVTYEYDSSDSTAVGSVSSMPYQISGDFLIFNGSRYWRRVDDGTEGPLAGAWEITAVERDGQMTDLSERRNGPRKTMKILSGTHFQWIAFNTATGAFHGTGGGTYTTNEKGLYVERIKFFSRDDSRVGQHLSFDYALRDGKWVHRGKSSTGKALHEIWSQRNR